MVKSYPDRCERRGIGQNCAGKRQHKLKGEMDFTLDKALLAKMGEAEKKLFIYEWLCQVHKNLHLADKVRSTFH